MIIGREVEQALLSEAMRSDQAEFLVVYGRRRIGKTFLIESYFNEQDCVFFHVTGIQSGKLTEHLDEFAKEIGRVFYGGVNIETSKSWMKAFETLTNAANYNKSNKPVVLFFDEFPWMSTPRSRLIQALEYYWNRFWKNTNKLKLILCGSSASWIIKKIIRNKGGLHNRLTRKLNLKPFDLESTKLFMEKKGINLSDKKILELYFMLGGVPYYLSQMKKGLSVAQNINNSCFQESGVLHDEFQRVFSSLFQDHKTYEEIIKLISKTRHGISRRKIENNIELTKKGGTLSKRLEDLELAGFIKKFLPMNNSKRGIYYRISDEYSYFYLQWIAPEKGNIELEIEENNLWLDISNSHQYHAWCGYAFESLCYKHVAEIKNALGIRGSSKIATWRYHPPKDINDNGAQIDLIFDRNDNAITICDIKWSDKPFTITKDYARQLRHKVDIYQQVTRTKKQLFLAMITVSGVKKNKYLNELVSYVVTLDDFFKKR